ncbi:hypothetical protein C5167_048802 [Papaver somniferum]|uniref:DCD domain-containing protein n=1 Tax=Papaver somniferum TaxID=3469 RepID=A0A4Y7KMC7_PAPSO|nr:hypothetical protein C5167_048802 [Papaver somniferum]
MTDDDGLVQLIQERTGAGRQTQTTFPFSEGGQNNSSISNPGKMRNLRKFDLGGVIFGCTRHTMKECLSNQIFGLPGVHFSYIKNIEPGLPLFLFNYTDKQLLGIYEAAIKNQDGHERTQYPAQVRICVRRHCKPLSENQYMPIIAGNYYTKVHFRFELDHAQTSGLISLFEKLPKPVSVNPQISCPPMWVSKHDKKAENESARASVSDGCFAQSDHANIMMGSQTEIPQYSSKENILQDTNPNLDVNLDWNSSNMQFDRFNLESSSLNAVPSEDKDHQNLQPGLHTVEWGDDEELVVEREQVKCHPTDYEENVAVPCESKTTSLGFDCEPEVPSFTLEKHEEVTVNSSVLQSLMCQLRQEFEELKVQQLQKTSLLEKKLTESQIQVKQLNIRVKELESQLVPSVACVKSSAAKETSKELIDDLSLGANELLFLIGGFDGNSWLSAMDCYLPSSDSMRSLRPMNLVRSYAAASALNDEIYVFCGGDGTSWYDTVESYNPQRNEWIPRGVTLHNKIFAIGGGDGVNCYSDVEMFDPVVGTWIHTQSIELRPGVQLALGLVVNERFSGAAAELNGVVYATGGFDGDNYLNSVERFDPREVVSWSRIPSMNTRRGCHSLVIVNEKLYALGGYDGSKMISSVEVYDPQMQLWTAHQNMKEPRGYSSAAVVGDTIFAISGLKEGKMVIDTVESYKEGLGWQVSSNLKCAGKRCFSTGLVV